VTTDYTIVAVIVRRAGDIMLVGQELASGEVAWSLPAGQVQPFESVRAAAARELKEETGLNLTALTGLAYVTQVNRPGLADRTIALVFECHADGDVLIADPDNEIVAAEFIDVDIAIQRLQRLPWRAMWEPAVEYLAGRAPTGSFRSYEDGALVDAVLPACDETTRDAGRPDRVA
jgi:8-oxo-dGTP diphosphatase